MDHATVQLIQVVTLWLLILINAILMYRSGKLLRDIRKLNEFDSED